MVIAAAAIEAIFAMIFTRYRIKVITKEVKQWFGCGFAAEDDAQLVENYFNQLKEYKRIAIRADKMDLFFRL